MSTRLYYAVPALECANVIIHATFIVLFAKMMHTKDIDDVFYMTTQGQFAYDDESHQLRQFYRHDDVLVTKHLPDECQLSSSFENITIAAAFQWSNLTAFTKYQPIYYNIQSISNRPVALTIVFSVMTTTASIIRLISLYKNMHTETTHVYALPKYKFYIEYFFSAPVMLVVIALTAGVRDIAVLAQYAFQLAGVVALGFAADALSYCRFYIAYATSGNDPAILSLILACVWATLLTSMYLYIPLMYFVYQHFGILFAEKPDNCARYMSVPPSQLEGLFLSQIIIFSLFIAPYCYVLAFMRASPKVTQEDTRSDSRVNMALIHRADPQRIHWPTYGAGTTATSVPKATEPWDNQIKYRSLVADISFLVLSITAKAALCYYVYVFFKMRAELNVTPSKFALVE